MHDPTRLSAATDNPLLAQLLSAGAAERPRLGALEKTLLAVSAGGALASVSTTATSTVAAGGGITSAGAGAGALGKAATGALLVTVGKWAGLGALAIGLNNGVQRWVDVSNERAAREQAALERAEAVALTPRGELPSQAPRSGTAGMATAGMARERPVEIIDTQGLALSGSVPSALPRGARESSPQRSESAELHRVPSSSSVEPATTADALALEIALVDRGRANLQARAWNGVLDGLADYESECPRQQLVVEVLVLRMEARLGLQQWANVRSLATRVLALAGGAPQGVRAREVLAQVSAR